MYSWVAGLKWKGAEQSSPYRGTANRGRKLALTWTSTSHLAGAGRHDAKTASVASTSLGLVSRSWELSTTCKWPRSRYQRCPSARTNSSTPTSVPLNERCVSPITGLNGPHGVHRNHHSSRHSL